MLTMKEIAEWDLGPDDADVKPNELSKDKTAATKSRPFGMPGFPYPSLVGRMPFGKR